MAKEKKHTEHHSAKRIGDKYGEFFELSPDGIAVTDLNRIILAYNKKISEMWGETSEGELLGMDFLDLVASSYKESALKKMEEIVNANYLKNVEYEFIKKDGTSLLCELSSSLVRNELGQPDMTISIIRDIGEKRKSELALQESENRFRLLIQKSSEGVVLLDEQGKIIEWNDAQSKIFGIDRRIVLNNDYAKCFFGLLLAEQRTPERWEFLNKLIHEAVTTGTTESIENIVEETIQPVDGRRKIVQQVMFPIRTNIGFQLGILTRDISNLKRYEQEVSMLAQVVRGMHECVIVTDLKHTILFVNAAFEKMYGYEKEELTGRAVKNIIADGHFGTAEKAFHDTLHYGQWQGNIVNRKKNGAPYSAFLRSYSVQGQHGEPIAIVGIMEDRSETEKTETMLRKIVDGTSKVVGREFLNSLVHSLAETLDVKFAYVAEILEGQQKTIRSMAFWHNNDFGPVIEFPLTGSPMANILHEDIIVWSANTSKDYERNLLMESLNIEFYAAMLLRNVQNIPMGMLVIMDNHERGISPNELSILRIFAARASAEVERIQNESQLRKLSLAIEQSPDAVMIISKDQSIEYINPRYEKLTGFTYDEIRNKKFINFFEELAASDGKDMLERAFETGKGAIFEVVKKRKTGDSYISYQSVSPIENEKGVITHFLILEEDVTQRKRMEERLLRSEVRYREFFEHDLTGDYICTVDGRLFDCNPAFASMFGYRTLDEAKRANIKDHYPSPDAYSKFVSLLKQKRILAYYELEMHACNSTLVYVVQNATGIFNEFDELVEIRGYLFNDTERRQLEMQLRQNQKMDIVGTLASGIAHDFNNILNNIIGFSNQIRKHLDNPDKIMRYCETVEKSASRGAQIANQLLIFTKKKAQEHETVDVDGILQEVVTLARETFPKNIEIQTDVFMPYATIKGDRGSLYEVFLNLCVNARDAMPEGGKLILSAVNLKMNEEISAKYINREAINCMQITVSDTGTGIAQDIIPKIFDPFFTTKERGKGTGLGLSIVYNAVNHHGGKIFVQSEVDKGTTFTIYLPVSEPEKSISHDIIDLRTFHGKGELVLLVDDEEPMQILGKEMLEEYGYRTLVAANGQEAVDIYKQRNKEIDLVILDLIMPLKDGGKAYLEMKEINRNIKAFFCSGFTSDKVITQLLQQENLVAIQKPFHPNDFIKMVHQTLHS